MNSDVFLLQSDSETHASKLHLPEPVVANVPSPLTVPPAGASFSAREMEGLANFVDQLSQVQYADRVDRLDELRRIFADAVGDLGFKHFTYHVARSSGLSAGGRLPYFISTYPENWVQHYLREHYLDEDPVVGAFLQTRQSFLWSRMVQSEVLSQRQRRLFDEARDAGIVNGATFPIHHKGEIAAVSLIPDGSGRDGAIATRRHRHLLQLMAWHYHTLACGGLLERSLTGESTRRRSLLSPREKQALEWAAKGKSTWEIGVLLGISNKCAEFHLEGAKRKLQVFNRTHAVAKAIMLGLLSFD